jgi:GNAT superfamily N-acetyltransferase
MATTIRKALESDADALAALVRGLGLFSWMENESATSLRDRLLGHLAQCMGDDSHTVLVAERDGVVGYVAAHWLPYLILPHPEAYVSELFVHETARGLGVGGLLLDAIHREAHARGCSRVSLLNRNTRESYRRGFYAKRGYEARDDMVNFVMKL